MNGSGIIELSDSLEEGCDLGQSAGTNTDNGGSESYGGNVFLWTAPGKPASSSGCDLQVLDPAIASPLVEAARLKRQGYEKNQQFQDT